LESHEEEKENLMPPQPNGFTVLKNAVPKEAMKPLLEYTIKKLGRMRAYHNSGGGRRYVTNLCRVPKIGWVKKLHDKYKPEHSIEYKIMLQKYAVGYQLGMHLDCNSKNQEWGQDGRKIKLIKVVIINLQGSAWFYLGEVRRKVSAGDVVIMEDEAVLIPHGVPQMSTGRVNIVMRFFQEIGYLKLKKVKNGRIRGRNR